MANVPVNSKLVKKLNRMNVLNILKRRGSVSRQELAAITGLTGPAITGIVKELLQVGFVKETGLGVSQGGRKPIQLEINPEAGYVFGAEVTRHEVSLGMANLADDPVLLQRRAVDMSAPRAGVENFARMIGSAARMVERKGRLLALGVAFPGLLDFSAGTVKRSVNLGREWDGYPILAALEDKLGVKVFIENNSNAAALAESWFGDVADCRDLVYVNWGEGISAGVISDERILQGYRGHCGEIGHIVIQEGGPLCNCGNRGCLEAICGIPALERKVAGELNFIPADDPVKERAVAGRVSIEDIVDCAAVEGSYCAELMRQAARYVGFAVADVVNILNPQVVVLGGRMTRAAGPAMPVIEETVRGHAFPEVAAATELRISSLDGRAGFAGACALALRETLESSASDLLKGGDGYRLVLPRRTV
jgi:predicted NBD/HSP70 family sugar kinase